MQESETECALDLKGQFACRPSCMQSIREETTCQVFALASDMAWC